MKFTLVNAFHSSGTPDGSYGGEAAGIVVELEDGTKVYFAGDTCVFGDMQLIGRLYSPDVAVLPIGGHYTMDPKEAAVALELLGTKRCVPCHFGTFPVLAGTPQQLKELAPDVDVAEIEPGGWIGLWEKSSRRTRSWRAISIGLSGASQRSRSSSRLARWCRGRRL